MLEYLKDPWILMPFVAFSTALLEYLWARAIQHVRDDKALPAANISAAFTLVQAVVTIAYVADPKMVPAAVAGAWLGTFIGVLRHKKTPEKL